jgi:hypothetical protein
MLKKIQINTDVYGYAEAMTQEWIATLGYKLAMTENGA